MMIILFGGGDGGGIQILNGRIVRIPPNNPLLRQATALAKVYDAAQSIRNTALRTQTLAVANALAANVEEQ